MSRRLILTQIMSLFVFFIVAQENVETECIEFKIGESYFSLDEKDITIDVNVLEKYLNKNNVTISNICYNEKVTDYKLQMVIIQAEKDAMVYNDFPQENIGSEILGESGIIFFEKIKIEGKSAGNLVIHYKK